MKNQVIGDRDFDIMLSMAASEQAHIIAEETRQEDVDDISPTKRFMDKMNVVLKKYKRALDVGHKSKGIKRAVACILVVICIGIIGSLSVDAARGGIWDFITQGFKEFISFTNVGYNSNSDSIDINKKIKKELDNIYLPKWLPEGFALQEYKTQSRVLTVVYKNDKQFIKFTQTKTNIDLFADNELSDYEKNDINGISYYVLIENGDAFSDCKIIWRNDSRNFLLISSLNKKDMLKIVQNVEYYG